jgi:hypothetical protein
MGPSAIPGRSAFFRPTARLKHLARSIAAEGNVVKE